MTEEYNIIGSVENWTVDGRIDLREGNKTLEELRHEFYKNWDNDQVTAFPLLQPGESQEQLLEKREIYQRPHAEIYTVRDHPTNRVCQVFWIFRTFRAEFATRFRRKR